MVNALAAVKQAAAKANRELGVLPAAVANPIIRACHQIRAGRLHDQFVVDVIQGGAGTSTNLNANEVITNLALELLDYPRGAFEVLHPLEADELQALLGFCNGGRRKPPTVPDEGMNLDGTCHHPAYRVACRKDLQQAG